MATLVEIKGELGIANLELRKSLDTEGVFTGWYRMWDNTNRVQISIHEDTIKAIQGKPETCNLGLQVETKISPTSNKEYTNKRIIAYSEADIIM